MIKNTFGESLVGIIIGVFILSFIILGVTNLLINSKAIINTYDNKKVISLLKNNTSNIIKILDTNSIAETELFYLNKNSNTKQFELFTGSVNSNYKYIDTFGNNITDIVNYEGRIYSRILWLERADNSTGENHQIIKVALKQLIKK